MMRRLAAILVLLVTATVVRGQGWDESRYEIDGRKSGYLYMGETTRALQDDDFVNPGFFAVERGRQLALGKSRLARGCDRAGIDQ